MIINIFDRRRFYYNLYNFPNLDDCNKELVTGDTHRVDDKYITASSIWQDTTGQWPLAIGPERARLNTKQDGLG